MKLYRRLVEKNLSKYQVSKLSGIPYSTLNDLFNEKTQLMNASVETLFKLAKVFEVSMEELLVNSIEIKLKRVNFELFRSHTQHLYAQEKDDAFMDYLIKSELIFEYYKKNWMEESLYLLAFLDYLSRKNHRALNHKFDKLRSLKLKEILYPKDVLLKAKLKNDKSLLEKYFDSSIIEFKRFNIVEKDLSNVA